MEAIACGTPVVTFNTGGSPEMFSQYTGIVVNSYDVHDLKKAIEEVCSSEKYSSKCCCGEAKMFDNASRFEKYLELL